jgi:hypothetical protein
LRIGPSNDVIAQLNGDGLWELTEHANHIVGGGSEGKTFDQFTIIAD